MAQIGCLILAAGGSTRLGKPKQLIEFRGETLVHAAVRAAQEGGCNPVVVVTGHLSELVRTAVADLAPMLAFNEQWQRGMGSSIRCGLQQLGDVPAVIVMTCDQPAVDKQVVASLTHIHRESGSRIVASAYSSTLGIPALFDRSCFPELLGLSDSHGAKAVIGALPDRVAAFDFPEGTMDIDSPDDLQFWIRHSEVASPPESSVLPTLRPVKEFPAPAADGETSPG